MRQEPAADFDSARRPAAIGLGDDGSRDGLQVFLDQVGKHRRLLPWEEVQLAKRIEQGDSEARERMVVANLRLVVYLACRHPHRGDLSLRDLIQDGIVGLITAVERFDWRRGCRFSTYATLDPSNDRPRYGNPDRRAFLRS